MILTFFFLTKTRGVVILLPWRSMRSMFTICNFPNRFAIHSDLTSDLSHRDHAVTVHSLLDDAAVLWCICGVLPRPGWLTLWPTTPANAAPNSVRIIYCHPTYYIRSLLGVCGKNAGRKFPINRPVHQSCSRNCVRSLINTAGTKNSWYMFLWYLAVGTE